MSVFYEPGPQMSPITSLMSHWPEPSDTATAKREEAGPCSLPLCKRGINRPDGPPAVGAAEGYAVQEWARRLELPESWATTR